MPVYDVTIQATVRKAVRVEADNQQAAEEQAHQGFTIQCDSDEFYRQDTVDTIEVQPDTSASVPQDMVQRVKALAAAAERRAAILETNTKRNEMLYAQAKAAADQFCDAVVRKLLELRSHGLAVKEQFTHVNHEASGSVMCFLSYHVEGHFECGRHVLASYPAYDTVEVKNYANEKASFKFRVTQSAEVAARDYVERILASVER